MVLDFNQGFFKIYNNSRQEIAQATNIKGQKVVPFIALYYPSHKITLTEQKYTPKE